MQKIRCQFLEFFAVETYKVVVRKSQFCSMKKRKRQRKEFRSPSYFLSTFSFVVLFPMISYFYVVSSSVPWVLVSAPQQTWFKITNCPTCLVSTFNLVQFLSDACLCCGCFSFPDYICSIHFLLCPESTFCFVNKVYLFFLDQPYP